MTGSTSHGRQRTSPLHTPTAAAAPVANVPARPPARSPGMPPSRPSPMRTPRSSETSAETSQQESEVSETSESEEASMEDDTTDDDDDEQQQFYDGLTSQSLPSPDTEELKRLKEAVNQRVRERAGLQAHPQPVRTASNIGSRRFSPIKEEDTARTATISPSLEAAFASSPLLTGAQTASTESTESARTIRGSVPATPLANLPLRTPSYPFPYVPGTPRVWSSSFHKPFTTLSPTVSSMRVHDHTPGDTIGSDVSTPAAKPYNFLPPGASPVEDNEDEMFPLPNLYNLSLELNLEPGIHAWWSKVAEILKGNFFASRASLAIPADPGDLENVPWAQIATYNEHGMPNQNPSAENSDKDQQKADSKTKASTMGAQRTYDSTSKQGGVRASPLASLRPELASRHSYAGFEKNRAEISTPVPTAIPSVRPSALLRTKTHAPHLSSNVPSRISPVRPTFTRQSFGTPGTSTMSDLDFSSFDTEPRRTPYIQVLPVMQALNHEDHALINAGYVNRIVAGLGKVVALTREYSSNTPSVPAVPIVVAPSPVSVQPGGHPILKRTLTPIELARSKLRLTSDYFSRNSQALSYQEHEQTPSSPWAMSPAPSPAIQNDPEENPFFTQQTVDESSFDPRGETPDYSKSKKLEAIGVDHASTIIHVPLIHPMLSQILPSVRKTGRKSDSESNDQEPTLRRAPIAILSVLAPIAPYPEHLLNSIKLLSPHLATSLGMAQQYSDAQRQASNFASARMYSGHKVGFAPFSADRTGLEQLMDADVGLSSSSVTASVTSPSDYSGRSRASPGGSFAGTPGWETGSITGRLSAANTPGVGYESAENYFDARQNRSPLTRSSSSGGLQDMGAEGAKPRKSSGHGDRAARKSAETRRRTMSTDEKGLGSGPSQGGVAVRRTPSGRRVQQQHQVETAAAKHPSYLHSFGADFTVLPSITTPARTPGPSDMTVNFEPPVPVIAGMLPPSPTLLRTIIDSLPVQLFTASPADGSVSWVNEKFLAYRCKTPADVLADPWQAVHPHDRDEYLRQWQQCLATGQQFASKVRLQRFDKVYRYFFIRATPLKDKKQNIVHWTGTYMDIHEQHVAEQNATRQAETAASEAKYRALANSSPQIVFAATRTRGVTFCNSQWLSYAGQTEAQARHLGFMDLVHPEDLGKCKLPVFNDDGTVAEVPTTVPLEVYRSDTDRSSSDGSSSSPSDIRTVTSPGLTPTSSMPQAQLSKLATTGILKVAKDSDGRPSYSTEVRLRNKEGEFRWHLVRVLQAEPVRKDDEHEEETWYGTCTDINDHKLLEQTLKETMDAKSRFLSNMSHEIRTPLNGIMGMVNFLLDSPLNQEQLEHINIIRSSTEGLRDLINDILDLSKVEAGMITLQHEWFHIRSLIEEVNDLTSSMAIGKGLELNYLIDESVPSNVKGDRFRIRQVLLNVVGNAIKFTNSGEVYVKVETMRDTDSTVDVSAVSRDTMLQFSVIDTGAGFTKEEAEFLFKRFSQIDSSSTKQHGGTGLGLAISKQLVQLHGGDMKASSVPGEGANFQFRTKFLLPTDEDHPPTVIGTPGLISAAATPGLAQPRRPSAIHWDAALARQDSDSSSLSATSSLRHESTSTSGSSDPLLNTNRTSLTSMRSSISSLDSLNSPPMVLEMPQRSGKTGRAGPSDSSNQSSNNSEISVATIRPRSPSIAISPGHKSPSPPALFSILIICPLQYARQAIVRHIETTIPRDAAHHITAPDTLDECKKMLGLTEGSQPVLFTHVVLISHEANDIITFASHVFKSASYASTLLCIISDFTQRKEIEEQLRHVDFKQMIESGRFRWLTKPLKPSKFAIIFDPQKLRELSTDRSQDSAQAVVMNQKQIFEEMRCRLGNRGLRVLLVEDNRTNQMVLQKFLSKVEIDVVTVVDGQECTDAIFGNDPDHFAIILCDLHMPIKDGYQTCREIRKQERKSKTKHIPIIALSANVLGDVYQKCAEAGFNSYVTKPVDFKELSLVMLKYLDPADPTKSIEFMQRKKSYA